MSRFYHVDFRSVRPPAVLWCKPSGQCASQVRAHLGSSCPSAPAALLQPGAGAEPSSHPRVRRSLVRWSRPASHRSPPLQAKEYKSVGVFFTFKEPKTRILSDFWVYAHSDSLHHQPVIPRSSSSLSSSLPSSSSSVLFMSVMLWASMKVSDRRPWNHHKTRSTKLNRLDF